MTCTKSRFARNNYATSAFNEYFLEQLREIDYPRMQVRPRSPAYAFAVHVVLVCVKNRQLSRFFTSSLSHFFHHPILFSPSQVVDAFNIVSARLEYGESGKCCNHFLCRDTYAEVFTAAPAGRIVLEAVERAICKASEG